MFNLFKRKSKKEKLQEKYDKLLTKAFTSINRIESDKIRAEAEEIGKKIDELQ